ncbi:MAG: CoA pyrophosphatase [Dehalobacterium sp.]
MKPGNMKKLADLFSHQPDIMFRDTYFNAAILLLLVLRNDEYHFVFEKRSSHIRQGSEICFPGGMFEPAHDQDFQHTAVRETSEELGIPANKIKIIGRTDTLITPQGVLVEGFIGISKSGFDEIKFDRSEVEYVFTVPLSFFERQEPDRYELGITINPTRINENGKEEVVFPAKALEVPEKYQSPWRGRKHVVYVYRYKGEVIWGITAAFIYSFIKKYKMQLNVERD